jgi:hypothetical protein
MNEKLTEQAAGGMTVNERLWAAGLMESFDQAVARKDRVELQNILKQVYVPSRDAEVIINQVLEPQGGPA